MILVCFCHLSLFFYFSSLSLIFTLSFLRSLFRTFLQLQILFANSIYLQLPYSRIFFVFALLLLTSFDFPSVSLGFSFSLIHCLRCSPVISFRHHTCLLLSLFQSHSKLWLGSSSLFIAATMCIELSKEMVKKHDALFHNCTEPQY